jgi:energy-coupling factor transporter ATP-binding protein EcfA2
MNQRVTRMPCPNIERDNRAAGSRTMRKRPSIIFIGPSKAGKSTLARLVAQALGLPELHLDDLRWSYYAEIGYDPERAQQIRQAGGMWALANYWKPFDIHGVERLLADYPTGHVISFGAGHSYYDDPAMLARAKTALAGFPNVILLLPSPDVDESVRIMKERLRADEPDIGEKGLETIAQINRLFIEHPSNASLATMTVYTAGKTPAETCAEIVQRLESPDILN